MNEMQQAAYIMAQAACAQIEVQGMVSANNARQTLGLSPRYTKEDFDALIEKYGIHHNAVIALFNRM